MGCYGIGIDRTLAAVAELKSDEKGLVWPACLSPYDVYLADLLGDDAGRDFAAVAKERLEAAGLAVLCDDRRQISAGEKLANADLLGFPVRAVVSQKTLAAGRLEIKARRGGEAELVPPAEAAGLCRRLLEDAA